MAADGAALGVRGEGTSPTYVIARVHPSISGGPDLVHVDAYRLGGAVEVDDLDLDASLAESVTAEARVSTNDQQTLAMQNRAMREYAAWRGWMITMQVRDVNSGRGEAKSTRKLLEATGRSTWCRGRVWTAGAGG